MILFICSSYIAIDVFLNSFIVVSTHHRRIASETGLKQDSLNPDSDSLIESTFFTESGFRFTVYPNPDLFNRISPKSTVNCGLALLQCFDLVDWQQEVIRL